MVARWLLLFLTSPVLPKKKDGERAMAKDKGVCLSFSYQESLSLFIWEILDFPDSLFNRLLVILVSQNWVTWPLLAAKGTGQYLPSLSLRLRQAVEKELEMLRGQLTYNVC